MGRPPAALGLRVAAWQRGGAVRSKRTRGTFHSRQHRPPYRAMSDRRGRRGRLVKIQRVEGSGHSPIRALKRCVYGVWRRSRKGQSFERAPFGAKPRSPLPTTRRPLSVHGDITDKNESYDLSHTLFGGTVFISQVVKKFSVFCFPFNPSISVCASYLFSCAT